MKKRSLIAGTAIALFSVLLASQATLAWPSTEMREEPDGIYDDWNINRVSSLGDNGFLRIKETANRVSFKPLITLESLGRYSAEAYELGERFAEKYPDNIQRATKIFEFVRDSLRYTTDIDQFDKPEYAQNADELAGIINEKAVALGDCEEHALLLTVMYLGAGYRAGIVLSPGHLAAILYLPEFKRANEVFTLNGDKGWIWLEATGNNNSLGWFPKGQVEGPILGYEVSPEDHIPFYQPLPPVLEPTGDKEINEDETLRFSISATDINDDTLTYSAKNLPEGARFDAAGGTFSWTPDTPGVYPDIHFEVTDGALSDFEEIAITVHKVNRPPVLESIGNREIDEDKILRFSVSATDANEDSLDYRVINLPEGADFNPANGTFSWTPEGPGVYPDIRFEVTDGALSDFEDITITVHKVNRPPVLALIGDKEVNEDEVLRFSISATDANDDALAYSAANLPEGARFDVAGRTFSWTPDRSGTYADIHFEVSDGVLADSEDIAVIVLSKGSPVLIIVSVAVVCLLLLAAVIVIRRRKARHT